MPDGNHPQNSGSPGFKLAKDLSPESKTDLEDAMIEGSLCSSNKQSVAFDTEIVLFPVSKERLQAGLTDETAMATPKGSIAKQAWIECKAQELYAAFEKGRKAESSTSGYSESSDRWTAIEGTAKDLRYILRTKDTSEQMAVFICVEGLKVEDEEQVVVVEEEEEEEEATGRSMMSASSTDQDEHDENWVIVEEGKQK